MILASCINFTFPRESISKRSALSNYGVKYLWLLLLLLSCSQFSNNLLLKWKYPNITLHSAEGIFILGKNTDKKKQIVFKKTKCYCGQLELMMWWEKNIASVLVLALATKNSSPRSFTTTWKCFGIFFPPSEQHFSWQVVFGDIKGKIYTVLTSLFCCLLLSFSVSTV